MEQFLLFMDMVFMFFEIPVTIYGYTFTYWQIFLFCILFSMVAKFFTTILDF